MGPVGQRRAQRLVHVGGLTAAVQAEHARQRRRGPTPGSGPADRRSSRSRCGLPWGCRGGERRSWGLLQQSVGGSVGAGRGAPATLASAAGLADTHVRLACQDGRMDLLHTFSLADVPREHRRSYPDRPAVVDGDTRLTWPQFDDRVNRLANALSAEGVGPGDVVLWMGQNSHRVLECLAAAAKLGAVCGIVNWRQSADEMAFVIADAGAAVTIWQEAEVGDTVRAARERAGVARPLAAPRLARRRRSRQLRDVPGRRIDRTIPARRGRPGRGRAHALHRGVHRHAQRRPAQPAGGADPVADHGQPAAGRRRLHLPELRPDVPHRHAHDHVGHLPVRRGQRVHAPRRRRGAVPGDRGRALHRAPS